jgi:hypothetical protein
MEIWMKKLASNLDIQLMCLPGLLGSSRRCFPLWCLVFQSIFSTKDFAHTSHFACKLIFHVNTVSNLTSETSKPSNIIPFESQELSTDSLDDADNNAINMLFMLHENIILKGGKRITWEVTYLGPQYLDEILQHKAWNRNGHNFFVDGILLSSMDVLDISTIPVSVEQYANELPKLTWEQLHHISHPYILDDDQQEVMGLHYKMNHLPLPAMITLAEKENSTTKNLNSNTGFQFACLTSLAQLIANHDAWKGKRFI